MSPSHQQQGSDVLAALMRKVARPSDAKRTKPDTAASAKRRKAQDATTVIISKPSTGAWVI